MDDNYFVYVMSNKSNTVLYIGVTNDLTRRVFEHKNGLVEGFTKRYKLHKLVYAESYKYVGDALSREKQLKKWSRDKKDKLINDQNPTRKDLSFNLFG